MSKRTLLVSVVAAALLLAGCVGTLQPTVTPVPSTDTPLPELVATATPIPPPTDTPVPEPTATHTPEPTPETCALSDLSADDVGEVCQVEGTISEPLPFSAGVRFILDDGSGTIVLLFWSEVWEALPNADELQAGAIVRVVGEIDEYEGELEIVPAAGGVTVVGRAEETPTRTAPPEATATPSVAITAIGDISAADQGQEVTVIADVVGTASFSAGFKFTLNDGSGTIVLLMWHEVYDQCWDAPGINLGARVRATGEVGSYEGELQIVPDFGGDVKALEPAGAWATPREIGSITGGDKGQRVMIEGEILRLEGLSNAVKVFVSDGTGEIVVFIWREILSRIPDKTAVGTPGTRVRVVGQVQEYRGNLELVPALPYDVVIVP